MDPVSHALFGRALATTRTSRPRGLTAALVLGSLMPDVDALWVFAGFDRYLAHHAAGTHALIATPIEAAILAAVLRVAVPRSRLWPLFIASWVGIAGHIIWDLADGSDIRLFAPFSSHVSGWHLVTMGEPAVLLVLMAIVLAAWRWPARTGCATALLAVLGAFVLLKVGSQAAARTAYRAHVQPDPIVVASTFITPVPGSVLNWRFDDRNGDHVRAWRVRAGGEAALLFEHDDLAATPIAQASRKMPVVESFLQLHGLPFARIEHHDDVTVVLWSDARKCSADECEISFGAAYDDRHTPLYQIIQVGSFRQTRGIGNR